MTTPTTPAADAVREARFTCKHGSMEYESTGSESEWSLPIKRSVMEKVAIELLKAFTAEKIAHALSVGILRARISQSALNYLSADSQAQVAAELATARESALVAERDALKDAAGDLLGALDELADLVEDMLTGNYTPDSFTTQPARTAIEKANQCPALAAIAVEGV